MEAIAEKYRRLLGVKSRFHNISLDQTLYHFPAALGSSSAEDKGEEGGGKKVVAGRNINLSFIASACWRTVGRLAIIFIFSTVPLKVTQEVV